MRVIINKTLAKAIIDMENIGFGESLGPESKEGSIEWTKLVQSVVEGFDLQDRVYNLVFRSKLERNK